MGARLKRPLLGGTIVARPSSDDLPFDVMVRKQQGFAEILEVERTDPGTGVREVGQVAVQYPTGTYWILREFMAVETWKSDATGGDAS